MKKSSTLGLKKFANLTPKKVVPQIKITCSSKFKTMMASIVNSKEDNNRFDRFISYCSIFLSHLHLLAILYLLAYEYCIKEGEQITLREIIEAFVIKETYEQEYRLVIYLAAICAFLIAMAFLCMIRVTCGKAGQTALQYLSVYTLYYPEVFSIPIHVFCINILKSSIDSEE